MLLNSMNTNASLFQSASRAKSVCTSRVLSPSIKRYARMFVSTTTIVWAASALLASGGDRGLDVVDGNQGTLLESHGFGQVCERRVIGYGHNACFEQRRERGLQLLIALHRADFPPPHQFVRNLEGRLHIPIFP